MALDDVVQGVKVNVSVAGLDDAISKLNSLDKAISGITKTATDAAGGQGGDPRSGISGLTGAFANLKLAGAGAFQTIAQGVEHGDLTGLATLMGGPVAGGVASAATAFMSFVKAQSEVSLTNAAMAKELGTTPDVVQALGDTFEKAGVSTQSFQRLTSRLSRDVTNEYASMMRNIRTDSIGATEAQLNLAKANKGVQDSFNDMGPENAEQQARGATLGVQKAKEQFDISRGVPAEAFEAQDKVRKIQEAQLALDEAQTKQTEALEKMRTAASDKRLKQQEAELEKAKAEEGIRQQALRSIPHITQELQNLGDKTSDVSDLAETDMRTFKEAIMHLAQPAGGGQADPIEYLKKLAEITKQIHDNHPELDTKMGAVLQQASGVISASGSMGISAANMQTLFQTQGATGIEAAQKRQSEFKAAGIQQTPEDTKAAEDAMRAIGRISGLLSASMEKIGSAMAKISLPDLNAFGDGIAKLAGLFTGKNSGLDALKAFFPQLQSKKENPNGTPGAANSTEEIKDLLFGPSDQPTGTLSSIFRRIAGGDDKQSWGSIFTGFINPAGKEGAEPINAPTLATNPGALSGLGGPLGAGIGALGNVSNFGLLNGGSDAAKEQATEMAKASAPIINLTVNVPGGGGPVTATTGSGGPVKGHWMGGLIKGFAAGGMADPLFAPSTEAMGPLYGDSPELEQKRIAMQIITNSMIGGGNPLAGPRNEDKPGGAASPAEGLGAVWELLTGHAGGGTIRGPGDGTSDSILARLSNGEFVMKAAAVRTYGANFMQAINDMQIPPPKFALGGMVPMTSLPHFASGGGVEGGGTPIHVHFDGKTFGPMTAGSRVVGELRRFSIDQQTSSTGRKPTWAGG